MKRFLMTLLVASISSFCIGTNVVASTIPSTGTIEVYFSPNDGPSEAIVKELDQARTEILVQAYGFTSKPISNALLDAKKRGVSIIAILDKSQRRDKFTTATLLSSAGILLYIDDKHAIAHNNSMIIDGSTLITGSFNFTKSAEEKNAENLLVIKGNQLLVSRYLKNFEEHKAHSELYQGK